MVRLAGLMMVVIVSVVGVAFVSAMGANLVVGPRVSGTSTSITASYGSGSGILSAEISVGPTRPVCYASETQGPAPSYYDSIEAVITDSSGHDATYPLDWVSYGCYVTGYLTTPLAAGGYTLNLMSCTWMGCKSALPKGFEIHPGMTTEANVSVFTGIL